MESYKFIYAFIEFFLSLFTLMMLLFVLQSSFNIPQKIVLGLFGIVSFIITIGLGLKILRD
jgi:Trk-type K+ transport system membrane component